jgi:CO dehydrogenase maturation factor
MRIAFVGKGGSGKSTVASLFIRHLRNRQLPVLAIDADINMHLGSQLAIHPSPDRALSRDENVRHIREHLRGSNGRIESADHVVKTTPPGTGSNLLRLHPSDAVLGPLALRPVDGLWFLHVGTYEEDGIGVSCYHTNLSIFENVLSHLHLADGEWLVADMVAGTDAFSNTLHAQFDMLALVVEPTPEGVTVYRQYKALAEEGGVGDRLAVIGNKVMDADDEAFLRAEIGDELIGVLAYLPAIKRARQQGLPAAEASGNEGAPIFDLLAERVRKSRATPDQRLQSLHALHRRYCKQQYIIDACGDIEGQIDPDFSYPA